MKYACTEARFFRDVESHQMTIIRDDGLYRHIRFRRADSSPYWFDLVTWPGILVINGDCGTHVFSRVEDMFEFFRMDRRDFNFKDGRKLQINPGYWSEKLRAPEYRDAQEFSASKFKAAVHNEVKQFVEQNPLTKESYAELWEEINNELFDIADSNDGGAAHSAAYSFDFTVETREGEREQFTLPDFWDHNTTHYKFHFIWNCYAIAFGIQMYDESKTVAKAA